MCIRDSYYNIWEKELKGKRAVIQGWGNVGAAAGYYLTRQGVKIVGVIDRKGGFVNESGFSLKEIENLLNKRKEIVNLPGFKNYDELDQIIWDTESEIFVPAAGSRLIKEHHIHSMVDSKLEVIACGANVPFADPEIFMGPILAHADRNLSVIPDFISNCGMARTFAFLMGSEEKITDMSIFSDTSKTIETALKELLINCPGGRGLVAEGLRIALRKITELAPVNAM